VARDGLVYGNRWVNARPDMSASDAIGDGDIAPWLDHCRVLVPEPSELNHIFNVMAYKCRTRT
jgi:hypothetical protein